MSTIANEPVEAPATVAVPKTKRFWNGRSLTSLTLTFLFLVMAFSGIILYVTPRGRLANWTDWTLLGLRKEQWASVHVSTCILFLGVAFIHLVLNWPAMVRYLKRKDAAGPWLKKEFFMAAVVVTVVTVGAVRGWPPFSTIMSFNQTIKNAWESRGESGSAARPSQRTLEQLSTASGVPAPDLHAILVKAGYEVNPDLTLLEIGELNGVPPGELMQVITAEYPQASGAKGFGSGGNCDESGRGAAGSERKDDCCDKQNGAEAKKQEKSHGESKGPGAGRGPGWGRGQGMGQGRGMGPGRGMGGGQGPQRGQGREHNAGAAEE